MSVWIEMYPPPDPPLPPLDPGGSGGRIAAYAKDDLFSGVGTYRAKGGASPATNGRGGPGSIYTKVEINSPPL
jgi:hypothetical protein